MRSSAAISVILAGIFHFGGIEPAEAQTDSVTVVASEQYNAGSFHQWLLGSRYRELWRMPIRVPVLDVGEFAGGLTPVELGGGQQTTSLRFLGADGREYQFRSVNKAPARTRQPDFAGALAGKLLQDQVSSLVPAAPVSASRIAIAAGLLHVRSDLYVLPDSPALGEYREEFAGMLGTLEERADELENGGAGFGGFERIAGTDAMMDDLEEDPTSHVDSRGYLAARLTDLILGDWDRHEGQWRWAREETPNGALWLPIPRDRDYAFSDYDGEALKVIRTFSPNAVRFSRGYADLPGLILNAGDLDKRVLADLDRPTWDSVTAEVQRKLTDREIDAAMAAMPPEYFAIWGERIATMLKQRRDRLPEASAEFFERISKWSEIYTTDEDETAYITRLPSGAVEVLVDAGTPQPYFSRRFEPGETDEIRLVLRGGRDRAFVRGSSDRAIRIRVVGGGGQDLLSDSSNVRRIGRWTVLYDEGDETTFVRGPATSINRREGPEDPEPSDLALVPYSPRDFGTHVGILPIAGYSTTRGIIVGVAVQESRFAYRTRPWRSRTYADLKFSTRWRDFGTEFGGIFNSSNPAVQLNGNVLASRIDALRFYGFGNETTRDLPSELYVVRREIVEATADVRYRLRPSLFVAAGPIIRYARPTVIEGSPLEQTAPLGVDGFSNYGMRGRFDLEPGSGHEDPAFGALLTTDYFPVASDNAGSSVDLQGRAQLRVPLGDDGTTSISARAGGQYVWGDYPFFSAAYLGGINTVRGFPEARFAGDGMVFGGAEVSKYLGRVPLLLGWRLSAFAFADAGRVFLEGEDSDSWHTAPGGGLELNAIGITARFSYAQGPEPRLYFETGRPF